MYDVSGLGEPLVLLPGGLRGWLSWEPFQSPLSTRHRVLRVQPIHNELGSAGVVGDPTYNSAVERESLRLTLDAVGIFTADFAGWSRGGGSLIDFAVAYPSYVRSLTLIEPAAEWVLDLTGRGADLVSPETRAALQRMETREVTDDDLAEVLVFAGLANNIDEIRASPSWDGFAAHRMALSWPYEDIDPAKRDLATLSQVTCPVLLVRGRSTGQWEHETVEVLSELLPNVRIVELDGDHASHLQNPDEFLEELERQLSPLVPPGTQLRSKPAVAKQLPRIRTAIPKRKKNPPGGQLSRL